MTANMQGPNLTEQYQELQEEIAFITDARSRSRYLTDQETVQVLEKLYSHRGLKFTTVFEGLEPVQAYGDIDGMRFYFRERGGISSLKVGKYDVELERKYAQRQNDSLRDVFPEIPDVVLVDVNDPSRMPTVVLYSSTTKKPLFILERFQLLLNELRRTDK
jgi:hypothetical protein